MIAPAVTTIRSLFSTRRPIDRPIEKVIDYYAVDDARLQAEVEEYEVTRTVEQNFRRFLDVFGAGLRGGQVTETGIWVSGFYGSGKSSFTKYLGFALDPQRTVNGHPFLDLLTERIGAPDVVQELRTLARREPTAVIMLDLGAEQLVSSATATISTVLHWKVLQWAGYSKEQKLAQLEFQLDRDGRLEEFRAAYRARFGDDWDAVHDNPLVGVPRADQLVPAFYPQEFPHPGDFRALRFSMADDVRKLAADMLDLVRRKSGCKNVLFLVDEAGQYVAPRGELILNLDGLARNLKELGQGRAWLVATGQQTLTEIVERALYNSAELNKLRDRFPIGIELQASDIREITWRRLLTKSAEGELQLRTLYAQHGQALAVNTRVEGSKLFNSPLDEETFVRLYPILPQRFDLLLELVRSLARSTIGLRSAIRVIQDLLVDVSKALPAGTTPLADQPVGRVATIDGFFDILRADIGKYYPHVVAGVERVGQVLPGDELALRVAKAIGALQPIENFPRTAANIAALLYRDMSAPPQQDDVRAALERLLREKETGIVDDPQAGGYAFLSEGVRPLRDRRNSHMPTQSELNLLRNRLLQGLFDPLPTATLEAAKTVRAGVRLGNVPLGGESEELQFRLEATDGAGWERRREALLAETTGRPEWRTAIAWLFQPNEQTEDVLADVLRSRFILREVPESDANGDVAQFLRSEARAAERGEGQVTDLYRAALLEGTFIFRGQPIPARTAGQDLASAARMVLQGAANLVYPYFGFVNIRPHTELAARFLSVERLDRMPRDNDPLGFVSMLGSRSRVNAEHPALAQALQALRERLQEGGRVQGNAIQDLFAAAPYGWSKDATRYVLAGLLTAGEIVLYSPTSADPITVAGQVAADVLRSTQAFGRGGVSLRHSRPSIVVLERASERLETMLGVAVLPLEDAISRAARDDLPAHLDGIIALPKQLEALELPGVERAQATVTLGRSILQNDGSGALAILGDSHCPFPADLKWAKDVTSELERGADAVIREARSLVQGAQEVATDFDLSSLIEPTDTALLDDVLKSDTFFTRLADLRGMTRRMRERAATLYNNRRLGYEAALFEVRKALEAMPEWIRVSEDDREEIGGRLRAEVAASPAEGQELAALRRLLARDAAVDRLRRELGQEVQRRAPVEPQLRESPDADTPVDFDLQLLPPTVVRTVQDLEPWFDELRAAVGKALEAGVSLRLRARP